MLERCFECTNWDGDPREPECIEICTLHKIFMRGMRDSCPQYDARDDLKIKENED